MNTSQDLKSAVTGDDVRALAAMRSEVEQLGAGRDVNGRTLLAQAVAAQAVDSALWLLDHQLGGGVNDADVQGETPLMRAAWLGNTTLASELLARGADIHAASNTGGTALHHAYAGSTRCEAMTQLLLQAGANPDLADRNGNKPQDWSSQAAAREAGEQLLKQPARSRLSLR